MQLTTRTSSIIATRGDDINTPDINHFRC